MIGSPAFQTNKEQDDAINMLWKTASPERQSLQNENWKKLAEMKDLTPAQFDIENYCLMAPKYWFDMHYDAKWLWKDMTLNTDILHSLYDSVFKDYFIFRNERNVPVPSLLQWVNMIMLIHIPYGKDLMISEGSQLKYLIKADILRSLRKVIFLTESCWGG